MKSLLACTVASAAAFGGDAPVRAAAARNPSMLIRRQCAPVAQAPWEARNAAARAAARWEFGGDMMMPMPGGMREPFYDPRGSMGDEFMYGGPPMDPRMPRPPMDPRMPPPRGAAARAAARWNSDLPMPGGFDNRRPTPGGFSDGGGRNDFTFGPESQIGGGQSKMEDQWRYESYMRGGGAAPSRGADARAAKRGYGGDSSVRREERERTDDRQAESARAPDYDDDRAPPSGRQRPYDAPRQGGRRERAGYEGGGAAAESERRYGRGGAGRRDGGFAARRSYARDRPPFPPDGRFPDERFPDERFFDGPMADGRFPGGPMGDGRFPGGPMGDGRFPEERFPDERFPGGRTRNGRFPDGPMGDGRFPGGPMGDGRFFPDGGFPDGPMGDGRFPGARRARRPRRGADGDVRFNSVDYATGDNGRDRTSFNFGPESQIGGGQSAVENPAQYMKRGADDVAEARGGRTGDGMAPPNDAESERTTQRAARRRVVMPPRDPYGGGGGPTVGPVGADMYGTARNNAGTARDVTSGGGIGRPGRVGADHFGSARQEEAAAAATEAASYYGRRDGVSRTDDESDEAVEDDDEARDRASPPMRPPTATAAAPPRAEPRSAPREAAAGRASLPAAAAARELLSPVGYDPEASIEMTGGTLRTWLFQPSSVDQIQLVLSTEGGPLEADIELWHGPDKTPCKIRVSADDGQACPFVCILEIPDGDASTVAVRTPLKLVGGVDANVVAASAVVPSPKCVASLDPIQGAALRTYPFEPSGDGIEVLLDLDGRPLDGRIELLRPDDKQPQLAVELYTADGFAQPILCYLPTSNADDTVIRVVNEASGGYPMAAAVVPRARSDGPR